MSRARPWYQRNGGEFVMGTMHMPSADHKWAYSAIVDMLNDRDRPLPDDAGFICGFTGLSKRRWTQVREFLLNDMDASGHTRLFLDVNGDISNPRFDRERKARLDARAAAVVHGATGGKISAAMRAAAAQPELALGGENSGLSPEKVPQESKINGAKSDFNIEMNGTHTPEINDLAQAPPQASCARASPRQIPESKKEEESPTPTSLPLTRDGDGGDVLDIAKRLALLGGVPLNPAYPGTFGREIEIVRHWVWELGASVEGTLVPTITKRFQDHDGTVASLRFYDQAITRAHAKAAGPPKAPPPPPQTPIFEFDEEDRGIVPFRQALCKALGSAVYCLHAHPARFHAVDEGEKHALQITGQGWAVNALNDGDRVPIIKRIARQHGFTEVW